MSNFILSFFSKLKINPFFWFVIALSILTGHFREIITWFIVVFIHEMGHFAGAHFFQWRVEKVELLPFGGVASVEEHGNRPLKEDFLVVLLGPLQHVWMISASYLFYANGWWDASMHQWFLYTNYSILGFNLLPIWPLDGGKIVYAVLSDRLPFKKAITLFLPLSFLCFIILFVWETARYPSQLNVWLVGVFLLAAHIVEWKKRPYLFMRFLLDRHTNPIHHKSVRKINVPRETRLGDVINYLYKGSSNVFVYKDKGREHILDEREVLNAFFHSNQIMCAIGELFR